MATYKFYIIRAKIRYPASKVFKSDIEYRNYLNEQANKVSVARLNETADYDKIYSAFKYIKEPSKTRFADKGENIVETYIYYFVQCKYENNKLTSHLVMDCRYPNYIQQYKREVI